MEVWELLAAGEYELALTKLRTYRVDVHYTGKRPYSLYPGTTLLYESIVRAPLRPVQREVVQVLLAQGLVPLINKDDVVAALRGGKDFFLSLVDHLVRIGKTEVSAENYVFFSSPRIPGMDGIRDEMTARGMHISLTPDYAYLFRLVQRGQLAFVDVLLRTGVYDLRYQPEYPFLVVAAEKFRVNHHCHELVLLLSAHKADRKQANARGCTAMDVLKDTTDVQIFQAVEYESD